MKFYRFSEMRFAAPLDEFDAPIGRGSVALTEDTFELIKETPCGYWIQNAYIEKRWVSKTARKRFAYPTREEALKSFRARKKRQISILEAQIRGAKEALSLGEKLVLESSK